MATLTKHMFSEVEAVSGRRFRVTSTEASAANVFHVAPATLSTMDECWVYAHNFGASDAVLTVMWGLSGDVPAAASASTASVDTGVSITIPFQSGRALVFDGTLLMGGLSAAAYADTTDIISIDGFVNRIA